MSIERIVIEKKNVQDVKRDRVFYSLVQIMVDDYFEIKKEYPNYIPYEIGKEFTTHLTGAFIILEPSDKEIKKYCRKIKYFDPISLEDISFVEKLRENLADDGARVIKGNNLILKAGVYAHYRSEKKERMEISDIISKYTKDSNDFVGERVTAALAFSIAAKKYTSIISQTIQPSLDDYNLESKNYSWIGTGNVKEFGPKGLVRMVKLEKNDTTIPGECTLKDDVYVKQFNYNFNESVYLSSENYLALNDIKEFSQEALLKNGRSIWRRIGGFFK